MKLLGGLLLFLALLALFAFMGWTLWSTGVVTELSSGSTAITITIVAGVLVTGLLTGVLMRLAFYSSKKGYDEDVQFRDPREDADPSPHDPRG